MAAMVIVSDNRTVLALLRHRLLFFEIVQESRAVQHLRVVAQVAQDFIVSIGAQNGKMVVQRPFVRSPGRQPLFGIVRSHVERNGELPQAALA